MRIPYTQTLPCGACITGGYVYCLIGKAFDDFSNRTLTQKCCQSATNNCPEATNATWTCSSSYPDRVLAKSICPYRSSMCGPKNTYQYNSWGADQQNNITVNVPPGETCSYIVNTQCGVPMFQTNETAGFDIDSFEYADDEASFGLSRLL